MEHDVGHSVEMGYSIWLVLFPLIGLIVNGLLARRWPEKLVGWFGSLMIVGSFAIAVALFLQLSGLDPHDRVVHVSFFNWLHVGSLQLDFAFLIDPLSSVMMLVVTGISAIIHIYSIGYMHGDPRFRAFFSYLNLFVFFMLLLVLGNNYPIMFIGWEGVGLASYLLIGFWWEDMAKATAGMKAFIVNRIGDFGMLIAMFLMFKYLGSLNFADVFPRAAGVWGHSPDAGPVIAIGLMLLLGAVGKSAQFPLYVWLPDAMAGPTPVSALIHAATMVTAGVYMIARSAMFFTLAPTAMLIVALVGGFTALYAATIGIKQFDIKKVLAYSTVSQLGYMVMACGVAAFGSGIFHLMTHAFFKALLFLGSGAVIHTMHGAMHHVNDHTTDPQDIRNMGGLRKYAPVTFWTFLIATLAISGIPGFSGFFSKDEILAFSFAHGMQGGTLIPWIFGLVAAAITAFYMFRLVYLTFYGEYKGPEGGEPGLKESPPVMTVPLIVLAVLSVVGGYVGLPAVLGERLNVFKQWLDPVFHPAYEAARIHPAHPTISQEWALIGLSVIAALIGIVIAWNLYIRRGKVGLPDSAQRGFGRVLWAKYYVDEFYHAVFVRPLIGLCRIAWRFFDEKIVDGGLVHGSAKTVRWGGGVLRQLQNGIVGSYAVMLVIGVILVLLIVYF
ncbi:MAG: NADH-quinone oxidoreductase subunit L [Calditrichaeota bacterium]|nr:NADH-quinone oxidoreductase subunit L [Calditrichota bacterium]